MLPGQSVGVHGAESGIPSDCDHDGKAVIAQSPCGLDEPHDLRPV